MRSEIPETVSVFLQKVAKNEWDLVFAEKQWDLIFQKTYYLSFRGGKLQKKSGEAENWRNLNSGMFNAVSEKNQDWLELFQKALAVVSSVLEIIGTETALIQRCFFGLKLWSISAVSEKIRDVHLCFRENQHWYSPDFELQNLGVSALFRAESMLFRDFQVMNSTKPGLKVFRIRADQRWFALGLQPG